MEFPLDRPVTCPIVIGRTVEVTGLQALLEHTKAGSGQALALSGEAGIGKTRLVKQARELALAAGFCILQGSCFPTDQSCPYAPLLDPLRTLLVTEARAQVLKDLGPLAAALFALFSDLLPPPSELAPLPALDAEQEKRRLFTALALVFTSQASMHPVLFVMEDMHWSDETSLEFLHYLARQCALHPLLLLFTYRSDEVHPGLQRLLAHLDRERLVREYVLPRLSKGEVEAMLRAIFAEQRLIPGELLEMLYTLTDGNPFFLEEVLKSLLTSRTLSFTDSGWLRLLPSPSSPTPDRQFSIPRSAQEAVSGRTRHVSAKAKQLLTLAAVAGRRFDVTVLQPLLHCSESQIVELLQELVAAQLVEEESADQFSFRHALTRQAIYAGLLVRQRGAMHRRVAQAIEQLFAAPTALDAHLADLAYHCFCGEQWEKAREYGQRAGEKALTLFAPRAALEHLTRAVEAASRLSEPAPASLYRARAQAYELLGQFERARADYEQALWLSQEAQKRFLEWQVLLDLGFLWASRDYAQAGDWFRRSLDLAHELGDPRFHARSLNRLANWLANTGRLEESVQMHQQALHIFEAEQDTQGRAETLDLLGFAHGSSGDLVTSASCYAQAIEQFRIAGDIPSLASSLCMHNILTYSILAQATCSPLIRYDEGVQELEEALRLAHQAGLSGAEAFAEMCLGGFLVPFGHVSIALSHLHEGLRIATEIGHQQWIAGTYAHLGIAYLLMLELTLAREALERALLLAREMGSAWWIAVSSTFLARAYLLKNELERAETVLAAVLPREQRPQGLVERWLRLVWGELALAQGQSDMALQIAQELLDTVPGAASFPTKQPIPWLLRLQGEALLKLERAEEAVQMLEGAKRGAQERQERTLLWRLHGLHARAYQQAKREEQARREEIAARNVIAEISATIDEPALCQQFTHAALATFWPGEKSPPKPLLPGGLTERECEVAGRIAEGLLNPDIAEALVISVRTVESHVSNILSKLGFKSRAQIAVWAAEKGLGKPE